MIKFIKALLDISTMILNLAIAAVLLFGMVWVMYIAWSEGVLPFNL